MLPHSSGREPRILLIEDTPATAAVFQVYLEELGLPDPTWVETLAEAEALAPRIASGEFDLIVSDLLLDDADASEFLARIGKTTDCPIIVCSGDISLADRSGVAARTLLTKPVSFARLSVELEKLRGSECAQSRRDNRSAHLPSP